MKKKIWIVLALLVPAISFAAGTWLSAVTVNPTAGQVLVDTGAISGPTSVEFCAYTAGSVAAVLTVEHRNAANSATLHSQQIPVTAGTFNEMCPNKGFTVADQERVRIVSTNAVTGTVSVSLFF
jgi:hypothetical protein